MRPGHRFETPAALIAVDGYHGSGKSTAAEAISSRLGFRLVHVDDFVIPGTGKFLGAIRYGELAEALETRPVIVEGVCILAVLERIGVDPTTHLYVQAPEPRPGSKRAAGPLAAEVEEYHGRYGPQRAADAFLTPRGHLRRAAHMVDRHVEVDIAFIRAKTKLAMTLAVGGIISLLIGLGVLLFGAASADEAVFELLGLEISASGIGGVIMATSAIWAFLAYQSRPIYSRHHQSSETMDENARLIQRNEWESTTQDLVRPPEPPPTSPKTFTERGE